MQLQGAPEKPVTPKPLVAVGSCLVGQPVRFNGDRKRHNQHIEDLADHFHLTPICPEVGIGLGVPRQPIRLVEAGNKIIAVKSDTNFSDVAEVDDYAPALKLYAERQIQRHHEMCGYILVKGSPSCGLEKVKRYNRHGNVMGHDATGVYAEHLARLNPLLPMEEDGRLNDVGLRESFVSRVYLYHNWRQLIAEELTVGKIINFYARYKYKIMAHHVPSYKKLGALLADPKKLAIEKLADQVIFIMMEALKIPATRAGHTNTLQHIQGYLKKQLNARDKQELSELIHQFRTGIVPLIAPITLLRHHFSNSPNAYIDDQVFMSPHPESMALRSHLQ